MRKNGPEYKACLVSIKELPSASRRIRAERRLGRWHAAWLTMRRLEGAKRRRETALANKLADLEHHRIAADYEHIVFKPTPALREFRHMKSCGIVHVRSGGGKRTGISRNKLVGVNLKGGNDAPTSSGGSGEANYRHESAEARKAHKDAPVVVSGYRPPTFTKGRVRRN